MLGAKYVKLFWFHYFQFHGLILEVEMFMEFVLPATATSTSAKY